MKSFTGTGAWLRSNSANGETSWVTGVLGVAWLTFPLWGAAALCVWSVLK